MVGQAMEKRLNKLGIETIKDLIFYYPLRYDDRTSLSVISDIGADQFFNILARVERISTKKTFKQRKIITEAWVYDQSGSIKVIWFNQPWVSQSLRPGDQVYLTGKAYGNMFEVYLSSPEYEKASDQAINSGRIVPVYPLTRGLSQKQLRFFISKALAGLKKVADPLPAKVVKTNNLVTLNVAISNIHFPQDYKLLVKSKQRLGFDEILLLQLKLGQLAEKMVDSKALAVNFKEKEIRDFVDSLAFTLTADQKRAAWQIIKDLQKDRPMNRLLVGDVGSGKTVVAAMALYSCVLAGYQGLLMAPTSILASQHYRVLLDIFKNKDIKIGLITSGSREVNGQLMSKKDFYSQLSEHKIDIAVGTQALIQDKVDLAVVGLAVVDEQHRFGVAQRQLIKEKSKVVPHFLSLSATPIPRSLALAIYGDLEVSLIKELPQGRKPIVTKLVANQDRFKAYEFIRQEIKSGRQAFVVCPLIDFSDKLGVKSVKAEYDNLNNSVFKEFKIGLLHGRLLLTERDQAIEDFKANKTKILVSTSVVEVGIDVPNASIMIIEDADRFGLAQLHQFRGRVGRSGYQSYCFLFSQTENQKTIDRLDYLVRCQDGFVLAQKDLEQRGSGSLYGYDQSGFVSQFKLADLNDLNLINQAKQTAKTLQILNYFDVNNFFDFYGNFSDISIHQE